MEPSPALVRLPSERAIKRPAAGTVRLSRQVGRLVLYAAIAVGAAGALLPFAWQVSTALKSARDALVFPPIWIPSPVHWGNFLASMTIPGLPFAIFFSNTIVITALGMAGNLTSAPIVAYAFARLRWTGRDRLFAVVLATIMLPAQVTIIPQFILFKELGWVNTFLPLIVPAWLGGGAFNIFLFRQFFLTLPLDLDDAAKIDGAGPLTILWRIILTFSLPALATFAVFSFVFHWNDFFAPLIYLNSQRLYTVSLALRLIVSQTGTQLPQWDLLMAASLIVMAPILILFFFAQRFFVRGIVFSGIRG
jgi:ABC-type glycerol-3-phosphate transport system permease component